VPVLKGAHIGRGARVGAGSVVSGVVAAGAFVRGVPARAVKATNGRATAVARDPAEVFERVKAIVAETFMVDRPLEASDGPEEIRAWDSLGSLRLLLALEDELHVVLPDDALYGVRSVADVADVMVRALEAK
jgi:acyl carrier protein